MKIPPRVYLFALVVGMQMKRRDFEPNCVLICFHQIVHAGSPVELKHVQRRAELLAHPPLHESNLPELIRLCPIIMGTRSRHVSPGLPN